MVDSLLEQRSITFAAACGERRLRLTKKGFRARVIIPLGPRLLLLIYYYA
jgi:hypothetical protein